jgi:DNA-binding transcriptional regulator YiaG
VGKNELKSARTRLNLTAKGMSEKLNTPARTYENWELGRTKIPGVVFAAIDLLEQLQKRT